MHKAMIAFAVVLNFGFAHNAAAQDYALAPSFGSANLTANFQPDPYHVAITAGGPIDVSTSVKGCVGMIADAPDFRLNYNAGDFPLFMYVNAQVDTTLLVNAPDGSWHCNDDTRGLDPVIHFQSPLTGQYDIWIGTWDTSYPSVSLAISEIGY